MPRVLTQKIKPGTWCPRVAIWAEEGQPTPWSEWTDQSPLLFLSAQMLSFLGPKIPDPAVAFQAPFLLPPATMGVRIPNRMLPFLSQIFVLLPNLHIKDAFFQHHLSPGRNGNWIKGLCKTQSLWTSFRRTSVSPGAYSHMCLLDVLQLDLSLPSKTQHRAITKLLSRCQNQTTLQRGGKSG